jgi:hypothetical protein
MDERETTPGTDLGTEQSPVMKQHQRQTGHDGLKVEAKKARSPGDEM